MLSSFPQIVLAYLMKKEGWTLREAYVHVKLRRPIVGPDKYATVTSRSNQSLFAFTDCCACEQEGI